MKEVKIEIEDFKLKELKILTILGTRPEIIRTSRICPKLDDLCEHIIVHTNQNFTINLKDIFFEELRLRQPDIILHSSMSDDNTHTSFALGQQLADMFPQIEKVLTDIEPDKVFILGDTNSALCAIITERMGIPVYHMEAANRSFNHEIPEEVNRKLIDSISSYNLFYTPTNRHTLLREGADPKKIFQCGNPTLEVLTYYKDKINNSTILEKLGILGKYFLADIHRSETVNNLERLISVFSGFNMISDELKVKIICSIHPKTKDKLSKLNFKKNDNLIFIESCGFFDFVKLEQNASLGLTDSGLCSEEYCILNIPCVIVRNETERPEVVEAGGAIISGINSKAIIDSAKIMEKLRYRNWKLPDGYNDLNVSDKVVNYILSKNQ
jgi:UDP-N-acetylglucosamine 2-epimerase (non-hydrolysing)